MDEQEKELMVKTSPVTLTVEKDGIEYEFSPIGDITDLVKLKQDIIDIMKRFKIVIRSKHIITITKSSTSTGSSFEEDYLRSKDVIREWYKENPDRDWKANELMEAAKFQKIRRSPMMTKLIKEGFIKCTNPFESRNMRKYIKAEAMITPEAVEKRDMEKLIQERKLVIEG